MAISNSYVKLPEGKLIQSIDEESFVNVINNL